MSDPLTIELLGLTIAVSGWTLFGLVGNVLFTARVLAQWVASERRRESIVPVTFWWLSLAAALIHIVYAWGRSDASGRPDPDVPMILGLAVTLVPYARNLRIHYAPQRRPRPRGRVIAIAVVLVGVVVAIWLRNVPFQNWWLFALGLFGNVIFRSRFVVQWVQSEAMRRSTMTLTFWYLSMAGSFILLIYSLLRGDLVFILGFVFNSIPYVRNIILIRRRQTAPGGC